MEMRISGKVLGSVSNKEFCERCFWIMMHYKLPYQIFPGIFSSIDNYTKKLIEEYFYKNKKLPGWLEKVGTVKRVYKNTSELIDNKLDEKIKFSIKYKNVLLKGIPNAIFEEKDNRIIIFNYKTARYTEGQDKLLSIYKVQLNAYAYIIEKLELGTVSSLYLVYFEPPEKSDFQKLSEKYTTNEGLKCHLNQIYIK
ncbi:MAG: PD-(D/E)XK nuclease family protein [Candidatus Micrarchaeia archaeon]